MKRIKSNLKKTIGFTLIEVLVGVAIAAISIVGVVELQKKFIKSGNEVNARAIAMQLTREKFDEYKAIDDFSQIISASDTKNKATYSFKRSWEVTSWYYDSDATSWGNSSSSTNTLAGKTVNVSVAWSDINGETQTVEQSEVFSKVSLHDSSTATDHIGEKTTPKVPFLANQTPENPSIELIDDSFIYEGVGNSKETSKPIPTVYAWDHNNLIQFETSVYDPDSDTQTLEDFATINCSCTFNGTTQGATPTMYRINDDGDGLTNDESTGVMVTKTTGKPIGTKQPAICDTCCRDHHDSTSVVDKYTPYSTSSVNHEHYNAALDIVDTGHYIEACRLRRVDGFYKVVPDWQLVDVVIMPISYFNVDSNVNDYVSYVKYVVKQYVTNGTYSSVDIDGNDIRKTLLPNRDLSASPGSQQLIARGIYVDLASLNSEDLTTIKGYVSSKANWLEYVPFYEVNLSLFGDWNSTNTAAVTVTNEDINTIVDPDNNYYGSYSRGRINASSVVDNSELSIAVRKDNTGITGSGLIAPSVVSLDDSINVVIDNGSGSGNPVYSITIEIDCLAYNNRGNLDSCKNSDTEGVNFIISSGTSIDCQYSAKRGSSTAFLSCSNVPQGWSGIINLNQSGFTFNKGGYIFVAVNSSYSDNDLMTENPP